MIRRPPRSTLFPSTTPCRSELRLPEAFAGLTETHRTITSVEAARAAAFERAECRSLLSPAFQEFTDAGAACPPERYDAAQRDRKSTRLNSSHANISYAVFCL